MRKRKYYVVPEMVANNNEGRVDNENGLAFIQDLQGRWVVNIEVAPLWPDIDWQSFEIVELRTSDFPVYEE